LLTWNLMPGIAGIIGRSSQQVDPAALEIMLKQMLHESFYTHGSYTHDPMNLAMGWVCQRASFSDCLPVWNEKKDIALIFSGEDFTDAADLDLLRARGHQFDSSNASYLVHLYEEKGLEFLADLNGSFCGLLADFRERKLVLFNDRYGTNRVHFHEHQDAFYFSSEAKSLLKVLPGLRQLDFQSLAEFLSCGCVLQNRSLFKGISLLPPGSAWTFRPGQSVKKECYFGSESWEQQEPLSVPEYDETFTETWGRILPRYLRGQQRIGLSLTGGVDSRMILAWAPPAAERLSCYTFGGTYRDCADVKISREIARICQQKHEVITVGPDFLSRFPVLAEKSVYMSDGTLDVTGAIDLYVQAVAREIAPVRVTGTNGGEVLRNLVVFKPSGFAAELLAGELAQGMHDTVQTYAQELKCHPLSFTAFKQAPWYMGTKFALEQSQLALRMPYLDNDLIGLLYRAPKQFASSNALSLSMIARGNPALGRIGTDLAGSPDCLPGFARAQRLLHKFTFKAEYAYDSGMPQWLARVDHVLAPLRLERLFLGRHKFSHFRIWYRDQLSQYIKDILLDPRTRARPHFRGSNLEKIVNRHVRGRGNYTLELQKILSIELMTRRLIEQN
jgi:asparagine synthase (glutamine-hydrolysing)